MNYRILIVTRHAGLIEYLETNPDTRAVLDQFGYDIIAHATEADVTDRRVIGILPMNLAALTAWFGLLPMNLPLELRGVELTLEQVKQHVEPLQWFKVISQDDHCSSNEAFQQECWAAGNHPGTYDKGPGR